MPPHSCSVPASLYCFIESSVSCVISFEWSTGKMKFDAWPVEPPGFGNGPLSSWTRSVHPSSASQPSRELPTMPPPITTHFALLGKSLNRTSHGQEHAVHRLLEVLDMRAHRVSRAVAVSGLDRLEERAVRLDRLLQLVRAIEGDRPDPQARARSTARASPRGGRCAPRGRRRGGSARRGPSARCRRPRARPGAPRARRDRASVARSAASRAASGSSTSRTSERRASSRTSTPVTNIPRRG